MESFKERIIKHFFDFEKIEEPQYQYYVTSLQRLMFEVARTLEKVEVLRLSLMDYGDMNIFYPIRKDVSNPEYFPKFISSIKLNTKFIDGICCVNTYFNDILVGKFFFDVNYGRDIFNVFAHSCFILANISDDELYNKLTLFLLDETSFSMFISYLHSIVMYSALLREEHPDSLVLGAIDPWYVKL